MIRQVAELVHAFQRAPTTPRAASRYALNYGWGCVVVVAWNLLASWMVQTSPAYPIRLESAELDLAGVSLFGAGLVAFVASSLLSRGSRTGRLVAWLSLALSVLAGGAYLIAFWNGFGVLPTHGVPLFFRVLQIGMGLAALFPLVLAFRYVARIDLSDTDTEGLSASLRGASSEAAAAYVESPVPFGPGLTLLAGMAVTLGGMAAISAIDGGFAPLSRLMWAVPVVVFAGALLWNERASSFERSRDVRFRFRSRITLFLFDAPFPFATTILYDDGVEIRVMFHRYFLPFAEVTEASVSSVFLSHTLVVECELPGVPRRIRLHAHGGGRVAEAWREARATGKGER